MAHSIYVSAQRMAAVAKVQVDQQTGMQILADAVIALAKALAVDVAALESRVKALECSCPGRRNAS